jgi:hypothetical protein
LLPDPLPCLRPGLLAAALIAATAFASSGCGEPPPPPMTKESYEAAKAEQEKMIINEYGKEAFQRAYPKRAAELIKSAEKK